MLIIVNKYTLNYVDIPAATSAPETGRHYTGIQVLPVAACRSD